MTERDWATHVVATLQAAGHAALFAGGCVRDELLGREPADYDIATGATPDEVTKLFRRAYLFGAAFGVVEVLGPRDAAGDWLKVQVATFRSDGAYTDGRRPDAVTFSSPQADAARRDFTVNGLFLDPVTGVITDYVGGRADLAAGVLRAIGDPAARFAEDKLRVLRAARMAARFGFTLDPATAAAARRFAPQVPVVSAERVADELRKLLTHPTRAAGMTLLYDLNLMPILLPELVDTTGVRQAVLRSLPAAVPFVAAFAALFAPGVPPGPVAGRLKLANDERDALTHFTGNRATVLAAAGLPPSELYPVLSRPLAAELVAVARAEALGTGADPAGVVRCETLLNDLTAAELDPPPLVTGADLQSAGYRPGPGFKPALARARAAQLDGRARTPADALAEARAALDGPVR